MRPSELSVRSVLCHNSLAIAARSREVLGLVNQILHKRVRVGGRESRATRWKRLSRESRLLLAVSTRRHRFRCRGT
jgi:hypothetical protein